MSSPQHFSNTNDLALATQIMQASFAEKNHVARSSSSPKHSKKMDSDAASVSSFGSSISMLKTKFHHSSSSYPREKSTKTLEQISQRNVLRNQVHIGI